MRRKGDAEEELLAALVEFVGMDISREEDGGEAGQEEEGVDNTCACILRSGATCSTSSGGIFPRHGGLALQRYGRHKMCCFGGR